MAMHFDDASRRWPCLMLIDEGLIITPCACLEILLLRRMVVIPI